MAQNTGKPAKSNNDVKPIKEVLSRTDLTRHLIERTGVAPKEVRLVLYELEQTMLGAVHKKGARTFMLPGLLKITVQEVPAKPKRMGKDPFTGEERMFAAKPASVKIKVRALKKLKDAAL